MKFGKILLTASVVSLLVVAGCAGSTQNTVDDVDVIKLGYIGPLTGGLASVGQDDLEAVEHYIEKNPVWAGKTVELIAEDGQCDGQPAANAAQKLINVDKVKVILGGACSGETLAVAPIAEANEVLLFSSVSTSPEVTDAGDFVFRNAPSDEKSTDVFADILEEDFSSVAVVSELNDFAAAYREALLRKLEAKGVEVTVDETYNSEATDFKTILQKVSDSNAEVLVNISGGATTGGFVTKQAAELGLDLPVYGTDTLSGSEYVEIAGDAAEGTVIIITSANRERAGVNEYLEEFAAKYGEAAAEAYVLLSYDRAAILHQAIEKVGYDPVAIRDYFYEMPAYNGLGGDIKFDENGDSSILPLVMKYENGVLVNN